MIEKWNSFCWSGWRRDSESTRSVWKPRETLQQTGKSGEDHEVEDGYGDKEDIRNEQGIER